MSFCIWNSKIMKDSNEFASNCLGCIKTFFLPHFREPPDGMVTAIVVLIMVIVIEMAVIIEVIARIMKYAKTKQNKNPRRGIII